MIETLRHYLAEASIVIGRVVTGVGRSGLTAADNAPRASVAGARCLDGVLTVVAPFLHGKQALTVAKYLPIFVIGKWATLKNPLVSFCTLPGHFRNRHRARALEKLKAHFAIKI